MNIESEIIKLQDIDTPKEDILDYIYSLEDELLNEKFNDWDLFLGNADVNKINDLYLIGIANITDPWNEKLKNRENFIKSLFNKIYSKYNKEEANELLYGIE